MWPVRQRRPGGAVRLVICIFSLPGDPLLLDGVYKKGFEMVNREKVDNWNLSSDAVLKIVLGRTEMIDALRKKYYQIGVSASERNIMQRWWNWRLAGNCNGSLTRSMSGGWILCRRCK